jgi:hypothetical protein
LIGININNFAIDVEKRLDEIFAEDTRNFKKEKKIDKNLVIHPLYNLKKTVLSMEWEITDELIMKYLEQLNHFKKILIKDKYVSVLIKLQCVLGNFIKTYKGDAHPFAFTMLRTNFISLNKIVSAKNMSREDKQKIIGKEIKRYNKLRMLVKAKKSDSIRRNQIKRSLISKATESEINKSIDKEKYRIHHKELSMYLLITKETLIELKRFIRAELKKLRNEIQLFTKA